MFGSQIRCPDYRFVVQCGGGGFVPPIRSLGARLALPGRLWVQRSWSTSAFVSPHGFLVPAEHVAISGVAGACMSRSFAHGDASGVLEQGTCRRFWLARLPSCQRDSSGSLMRCRCSHPYLLLLGGGAFPEKKNMYHYAPRL